jgi:hypothetical protein
MRPPFYAIYMVGTFVALAIGQLLIARAEVEATSLRPAHATGAHRDLGEPAKRTNRWRILRAGFGLDAG